LLILASGSPVRTKILSDAGIVHRIVCSGAKESDVAHPSPNDTAIGRAVLKARWVADRNPSEWVLGVDQVCYDPTDPSQQWGKPPSPSLHVQRLLDARGTQHALTTGYALIRGDACRTGSSTSLLTFRADTTRDEIEAYVLSGEGTHCAGGYAVEGQGGFLVEHIEGSLYNVLGLPIFSVWSMLRDLGWRNDKRRLQDG
jgi:septum formation protein